jgi:glycogen debranching enzyme
LTSTPGRVATAAAPVETENGASPAPGEAAFYISTAGSLARHRRTLKHNDTFAVFDDHGDIGATAGGPDGLFDKDTRFLSHLELLINDTRPLLLGSAIKDNNLNYYVDLTNPDFFDDGTIVLPKDTIHIARTMYLHDGALRERVAIGNHGNKVTRFSLSFTFAADFADIFEVRGMRRPRRGRGWTELLTGGSVALAYRGLDGALRETAVSFEPFPLLLKDGYAAYALELPPGARASVFVTASSRGAPERSTAAYFRGFVRLKRELRAATRGAATIETSNSVLNEVMCRSMADLYMLLTTTADGLYPYAGIPWYSTTFGRDGLITAWQMLWVDPAIAAGVLQRLARLQADAEEACSDASPGKILHEMRKGEMAALGEIPFGLYYGSVDATPLFVMLAGLYAERTGDYALIRAIWPAIERAIAWIDGPGDCDGDGFIEWSRAAETGLANQGWKDSRDSIFHADGRLAEGPIALVEVQGYVFAAKRLAAACARKLGDARRAAELDAQAQELRKRFNRAFWCEDLGTYAPALDGDKEPCRVHTSNAGHALATGIASPDRARRIAKHLLRSSFNSGWGIRTVAQGEARYNPMSYHNGSIWPHDNALIARGLAHYGLKDGIETIFEGLIQAASYMDHRRIPELYCGFRRRPGRGPTLYPVACSPQAWAAAAPFSLVQSMLGLEFDHPARQIRLINPCVPEFAGTVILRNLSLAGASADLAIRQDGKTTSLQVLRTRGDLQVTLICDAHAGRHG